MSGMKTLTISMLSLAVYVNRISLFKIEEEINITEEILKLRLEIYKKKFYYKLLKRCIYCLFKKFNI